MSKDFIKEIFAIVLSPITTITKMKKDNLLLSRDLLFKAYNEGIYHFTEDESSKKIMESKYLKSSKIITSYGARSCFFFAGIPTLDVLVINGLAISKGNLEKKLIAVKFNLPYEELVKFDYRCINDNALMYRGDYHFNKKDAKIVYLGLKIEDGKGIYKEILKEEY